VEAFARILEHVDRALGVALLPFTAWILLSGLDDLLVDVVWIASRLSPRTHLPLPQHELQPLTAIFVPMWRESEVIRSMVDHNCAAIDYRNYHFFLGAYPNDPETLAVGRQLELERACVHLATCPHDGPTSKADCLNWIYQHMMLYEESQGLHFDTVVVHDAEDLIHPRALTTINAAIETHDTVQVPVLALPTPLPDLTHGIYCDEFAEYQTRDMPVRGVMGAFLPSCGVGSGYRREALDNLAAHSQNRIFEPSCLTEDYENGLRLHQLGARQAFVAVHRAGESFLATREFFPRRLGPAVRQRTRWLVGNVFQAWERHGWPGGMAQRYWLWRDRKSIAGSLLTAAMNLISVYGVLRAMSGHTAIWSEWHTQLLLPATSAFLIWRIGVRIWCSAQVYGLGFAVWVPVRLLYGNVINALAASKAILTYVHSRWKGQPLRWVKTDHEYPSRAALCEHKRSLVEVLLGSGNLTTAELESATRTQPAGIPLPSWLVKAGYVAEEHLAEAVSLRESLPMARIVASDLEPRVSRLLPARVILERRVLPFRLERGTLHLASSDAPDDNVHEHLRRFTALELRFHVITRTEFNELAGEVLELPADQPIH
jgi:bacteriophage N4 adsorption protein B